MTQPLDRSKPFSYREMALDDLDLDRQADPLAQQGIEPEPHFTAPQWSLALKKAAGKAEVTDFDVGGRPKAKL